MMSRQWARCKLIKQFVAKGRLKETLKKIFRLLTLELSMNYLGNPSKWVATNDLIGKVDEN